MTLPERLRGLLPTQEQLTRNRWLRWLAPALGHPKLWHWSRRGVALGVALGVFFGLLVPLAQIPLTAVAAIALRANLPVAAASTLVTNPVTFGPLYYLAYHLGSWVTGDDTPPAIEPGQDHASNDDKNIWQQIGELGKPLLVGLVLMAISSGLLTYLIIDLLWRWRVNTRRRARQAQRMQRTIHSDCDSGSTES
jgi:uncharacterized protein (DUF2062 family)